MNKNLELRLIDTFDAFKSLEHDWNALYESANHCTIFSSWDWMVTWWEVFQDQFERELYILCLYDKEELVGIAPFQIDKAYPKSLIQGKTLRFIGLGEDFDDSIQSEYVDFIVKPEFETDIVELVSNYLVENKHKWNFADFEFVLEDALILKCFNNSDVGITRQKISYGVRFSIPQLDSFEEYHRDQMGKRWSKSFTKKSRILNRDGEVNTETTDTIESIDSALKGLADMHCARWTGKLDTCVFKSTRFYDFHTKILNRLVPQNRAAIRTITLNEKPLAAYYIFEDKGQTHYYQSGFYTKNANRYSPLFVLVCNEIGLALENKMKFDFMFDENPKSYKQEQYAASSENMYRLKWTPQPIRFTAFNVAKGLKALASDSQATIKNKIKNIREK